MSDENEKEKRLLKLSPRYFGLWIVLWFLLATKILVIRETTPNDFYELLVFGPIMLGLAYLGALAVWIAKGRKQIAGEIAYLALLALIFIVRTIFLYREALAGTS